MIVKYLRTLISSSNSKPPLTCLPGGYCVKQSGSNNGAAWSAHFCLLNKDMPEAKTVCKTGNNCWNHKPHTEDSVNSSHIVANGQNCCCDEDL